MHYHSTPVSSVPLSLSIRARVITLDLNELFRVGRRRWPLASRYSPSQSSSAKQWPPPSRRVPLAVSSSRACLFSNGSRIGGQSRYFFTTGGRSFDGAICINDLPRLSGRLRRLRMTTHDLKSPSNKNQSTY